MPIQHNILIIIFRRCVDCRRSATSSKLHRPLFSGCIAVYVICYVRILCYMCLELETEDQHPYVYGDSELFALSQCLCVHLAWRASCRLRQSRFLRMCRVGSLRLPQPPSPRAPLPRLVFVDFKSNACESFLPLTLARPRYTAHFPCICVFYARLAGSITFQMAISLTASA